MFDGVTAAKAQPWLLRPNATHGLLGWHALPMAGTIRYVEPPVPVKAGMTYTLAERKLNLTLCSRGLHACTWFADAIRYAPSTLFCRVRSHGEIYEAPGADKHCSSDRTVLWMGDLNYRLHALITTEIKRLAAYVTTQTPDYAQRIFGDTFGAWSEATEQREGTMLGAHRGVYTWHYEQHIEYLKNVPATRSVWKLLSYDPLTALEVLQDVWFLENRPNSDYLSWRHWLETHALEWVSE